MPSTGESSACMDTAEGTQLVSSPALEVMKGETPKVLEHSSCPVCGALASPAFAKATSVPRQAAELYVQALLLRRGPDPRHQCPRGTWTQRRLWALPRGCRVRRSGGRGGGGSKMCCSKLCRHF